MKILGLPRYLIPQPPPLDLRELGYGTKPRARLLKDLFPTSSEIPCIVGTYG